MISTLAVIPARWGSTRFPGKALASIAGRPMVERVWERVKQARTLAGVLVATDDERIAAVCRARGIDCEMTATTHATGTDRLSEVASRRAAEIYVNVQGDEPLIEPESIDAVVHCLQAARPRGIAVSTGYIAGASPEQEASTSCVHLVPTLDGCVLTFSRLPVPLSFVEPARRNVHVGLFAMTGPALERFAGWERGPVERAESIEMLRFLERGERIACVAIPPGSIGVDNPEDVPRVEAELRRRGLP